MSESDESEEPSDEEQSEPLPEHIEVPSNATPPEYIPPSESASTSESSESEQSVPESQPPPPEYTPPPKPGSQSGCLIATAAFGSELSPQVQFLRNFRDTQIMSTAAGSSFMTVFNAWYYSFSPSIADYERQTPLLQQFIKVLVYPLLGILSLSEKAYAYIPGEYGAVTAGMVASALIGITYLSPLVLAIRPLRHLTLSTKYAILIMSIVIVGLIFALASGNTIYIMITSSLLVLVTISISALCFTKSILICKNTIRKGF